ncbi:MAG: response regulator [Myxococcales bacterium]|nr:response regulator [Myxococcales bacterium]
MAEQPTILIVDDVDMFRELEGMFLHALGTVIEAASGAQAKSQIEAAKPDLVVLDLKLPDCDAHQLCQEIKRDHPEIIVVAISADGEPGEHEAAVRCGADDVVAKPLIRHMLVNAVRRFLAQESPLGLPRAHCRIPVRLADGQEGWLENLSRGGLFIAADGLPEVSSEIRLEFRLPDEPQSFDPTARVVWTRESSDPRKPRGFGVRFLALPGDTARRLDHFVHEHAPNASAGVSF